jgi:hypothetical protein
MKDLIYTLLDLEEWCIGSVCDFCFGLNKASYQIKTRDQITNKMLANDFICENCKVRFENDEILKCSNCGRLRIQSDIEYPSNKIICRCVKRKENTDEKKLPLLPHQSGGITLFYETQINNLREELTNAEVENGAHLEALEVAEDWHKRQKQELLDRIKELESEVERLKGLTNQELINELNSCREKIKVLEEQNGQLMAQIEVKEPKKWSWLKIKK